MSSQYEDAIADVTDLILTTVGGVARACVAAVDESLLTDEELFEDRIRIRVLVDCPVASVAACAEARLAETMPPDLGLSAGVARDGTTLAVFIEHDVGGERV